MSNLYCYVWNWAFVQFELGNLDNNRWKRWIIITKDTKEIIGTGLKGVSTVSESGTRMVFSGLFLYESE